MIAIRGAIQVEEDTREAIGAAAAALCVAITQANQLAPERIVSAFFTLTPDLHADFPARAAREQCWGDVPMICAQEIAVPGALPRVCRVLLHVDAAGSRVLALVDSQETGSIGPGDPVALTADPGTWHAFDAESGARLEAALIGVQRGA